MCKCLIGSSARMTSQDMAECLECMQLLLLLGLPFFYLYFHPMSHFLQAYGVNACLCV